MSTGSPGPAAEGRHRVVLLGASNLTRGFGTVVRLARERLGAPLELMAALGHGRSYGLESTFVCRTLPPIDRCGLWERLRAPCRAGPRQATAALVCDVGNDVAYGVAPGRLVAWVGRALDRLERAGARPVLVGLPVERIERLDPFWFAFWSRLFFPGRGLEHRRVLDGARAVEEHLEAEARRRGLALVPVRGEWFARDPIHYARARAPEAWGAILAAWGDPEGGRARPPARGRLRAPPAAERRWLGLRRTTPQPSRHLADGTTLSMY